MKHKLSIENGLIRFHASIGDEVDFKDEDVAADVVATYLILTQIGRIKLDASCSEPDNGRPNFDTERFLNLISDRVEQRNAATLH